MPDTSNSQLAGNINKHLHIFFYIHNIFGGHLFDIQRYPKDVGIGLSIVNKAGGYEKVHKLIQMKLLISMDANFIIIFYIHMFHELKINVAKEPGSFREELKRPGSEVSKPLLHRSAVRFISVPLFAAS